jgi:hypothetical protein
MEIVILTIGIDLGERVNPTAIALLELVDRAPGRNGTDLHFECHHLERLALGTKYPDVARRVAAVQVYAVQAVRQRAFDCDHLDAEVWITTWVDATCAIPALDILNEQGIDCRPVFFTHGDRRTEQGRQVTLGKAWLVNRLQALFQRGRLHLPPDHLEAAAMTRELLDYEILVDQNAIDPYGAFSTGSHDDLVTALGLAAQVAPEPNGWRQVAEQMLQSAWS